MRLAGVSYRCLATLCVTLRVVRHHFRSLHAKVIHRMPNRPIRYRGPSTGYSIASGSAVARISPSRRSALPGDVPFRSSTPMRSRCEHSTSCRIQLAALTASARCNDSRRATTKSSRSSNATNTSVTLPTVQMSRFFSSIAAFPFRRTRSSHSLHLTLVQRHLFQRRLSKIRNVFCGRSCSTCAANRER